MISQHLDVVVAAKAYCLAHGIPITGPDCFNITLRAAWALRAVGAGLLDKPIGAHSEYPAGSGHFYSSDIVCFPDGRIFDVLVSAGAVNGPQWEEVAPPVDPARYRPAVDPGDEAAGPPAAEPPPPAFDIEAAFARVDRALIAIVQQQQDDTARLLDAITRLRNEALDAVRQYGPALIAGVLGKKP